ncbi:TPA: hypothetical protein N0F65_012055 [Lagenidium giganteum]|uniref:Uncharacterized protein n=1 Tax=Lagenidium giganteum TaxID=4803 RepID=A0AAV2YPI0_9STRA|nr:TPA: hypothetical protein N0F65_012055 [Lagenidium giganteum]
MKKSTRLFDGGELASVANVTMRLKQDRKHNGETVYGSSVRMLQYMTYYPGLYSHLNASSQLLLDSVTQELQQYDVHTFRIIGSGTSGLNTFKDDWWASTMQTYRLAEIPNNSTTPVFDAWWDEEARVAAWFGGVERSPSAPFFMLDRYFRIKSTGIVLDDDPTTRCHRALFKTLGKLLFMGVTSQVSTIGYTVFMSDADGHIRAWAQNVARKFELHGETLVGKKYAFSYSPSAVVRKDDGSAWVMVPLVEAMVRELQFETMLNLVLGGYNESFTTLVSAEAGKVHFSDSYHCIVDLVDTVVDTSDSTAQIRNKLYPGVVRFFTDLMVGIHDMYANLSADLLQKEGIQMVKIPKELLANNSVDDGSGGSPLQWQPTALTAGILKFFPGMTPPVNVIWEYRNATRCYRSLELRYLNESVRCWVEENSNEKGRVEYKSEAFRLIMFSNWSISLVLNCIAIAIALEF